MPKTDMQKRLDRRDEQIKKLRQENKKLKKKESNRIHNNKNKPQLVAPRKAFQLKGYDVSPGKKDTTGDRSRKEQIKKTLMMISFMLSTATERDNDPCFINPLAKEWLLTALGAQKSVSTATWAEVKVVGGMSREQARAAAAALKRDGVLCPNERKSNAALDDARTEANSPQPGFFLTGDDQGNGARLSLCDCIAALITKHDPQHACFPPGKDTIHVVLTHDGTNQGISSVQGASVRILDFGTKSRSVSHTMLTQLAAVRECKTEMFPVLAAQSDEVSTLEESGINIGARHFDITFFLCDDLKSAMIINSLYGTSAMHNCAHCDATKTQIKSGQTGQLRTLASHTVHVKRVEAHAEKIRAQATSVATDAADY